MSNVQEDFDEEYAGYKEYLLSLGHEHGSVDELIGLMYKVWKAAHNKYNKDIVVELPERQRYEEAGCYYDEMNSWEVIEALNEAGIKYK